MGERVRIDIYHVARPREAAEIIWPSIATLGTLSRLCLAALNQNQRET